MKKNIYFLTVSFLLGLMIASCGKEDNVVPIVPSDPTPAIDLPHPAIGTGTATINGETKEIWHIYVDRSADKDFYKFYLKDFQKYVSVEWDYSYQIAIFMISGHNVGYTGSFDVTHEGENYHIEGRCGTESGEIVIEYDGRVYDYTVPFNNGEVTCNGVTSRLDRIIADKTEDNTYLTLNNNDGSTLFTVIYNYGMLKSGEYTITSQCQDSTELAVIPETFDNHYVFSFDVPLSGTMKIGVEGETVTISATVNYDSNEYIISYSGPILWRHWE